jgi:hypothetical protein
MDNHKEDFSPAESLQIIQTMIDKTKNSVADKSFYFLLWGWLVFIGAILQFVLKVFVGTEKHPMAWNIMFIGIILSLFRRARKKDIRVKTYVDEGLETIWTCIGIIQILIVFIFMRRGGWENCYTIFILAYSIGCFLTGRLLKFPTLVWGAIACWGLAILSTFASYDMNILLLAAAILISYIIPGHLLRRDYIKTITKAV